MGTTACLGSGAWLTAEWEGTAERSDCTGTGAEPRTAGSPMEASQDTQVQDTAWDLAVLTGDRQERAAMQLGAPTGEAGDID